MHLRASVSVNHMRRMVYFALMEESTESLKKDSKKIPSLKRVAEFFTKVVETKKIKY
jgi:hypothetical protein